MKKNNNDNNINLDILAGNNTNRNKQKPPANTREQNMKKISQNQIELNRVKQALRNIATTSNNNNSQFNVTRSQVIKYHKLAKEELLKSNHDIIKKMLNLETKTHAFTLKAIKLSPNFFSGMMVPVGPGGAAPVAPAGAFMNAAPAIPDRLSTYFGAFSRELPREWHSLYKLSKLVRTIRDDDQFPWKDADLPAAPAGMQQEPYQAALQQLQTFHKTLGDPAQGKFTVKHGEDTTGKFMIVIRYTPPQTQKFIEWTYAPGDDTLMYALTFLRKLPQTPVEFSLDYITNLKNNDNHGITARVIPMFTINQSMQTVRKAMEESGFPSRFWQMNALKLRAQKNKVNNFSDNFSNTKQSRIESFLGKVDDLFTLIANGQQAHLSPNEIRKIIDSFAINPHMYTLQKQNEAIKQITRPLQRANNNRQILLANPNYNNNDKRILSFPTGGSLIGVLELLDYNEDGNYKYGIVGIRHRKNRDFGTTIRSTPIDNPGTPLDPFVFEITETNPQFQKYVKNGQIVNPKPNREKGDLHKAVTVLAHFCIWFGTLKKPGGLHNNLREWYDHFIHTLTLVTTTPRLKLRLERMLIQYKQFTQKKIKYLISVLPKHFKLIPLLKEYCRSQNDDAYKWFLGLGIL